MLKQISLPAADEYAPFYADYIQRAQMTGAKSAWVITDSAIAHTADAGLHWVQQPVAPMDNSDVTLHFYLLLCL